MSKLTIQDIKESAEYRTWVKEDRVALIHNTYYDSSTPYTAWIVIENSNEVAGKVRWHIKRFFPSGDKIQVSHDYKNVSTKEVFHLLLTQYSRGLA